MSQIVFLKWTTFFFNFWTSLSGVSNVEVWLAGGSFCKTMKIIEVEGEVEEVDHCSHCNDQPLQT